MDDERVAAFRRGADRLLTPLNDVRDRVRRSRDALDAQHPDWRAAKLADPSAYLRHDARREYFTTLDVILRNAQVSYALVRDQLTEPAWYASQQGGYRADHAAEVVREYLLMVKFFTVQAAVSATEETLRAVVRAAPAGTFTSTPQADLSRLYPEVLEKAGLAQRFRQLFDILHLTRTTIHTNGVFYPRDGQPQRRIYAGREFAFEVGKGLDWADESAVVWLTEQLADAMRTIVLAPLIATLPRCPRGG